MCGAGQAPALATRTSGGMFATEPEEMVTSGRAKILTSPYQESRAHGLCHQLRLEPNRLRFSGHTQSASLTETPHSMTSPSGRVTS